MMGANGTTSQDIHIWIISMINSSTEISHLQCIDKLIKQWCLIHLNNEHHNNLYRDATDKLNYKIKMLNGRI